MSTNSDDPISAADFFENLLYEFAVDGILTKEISVPVVMDRGTVYVRLNVEVLEAEGHNPETIH